jgi:hypothetical protein
MSELRGRVWQRSTDRTAATEPGGRGRRDLSEADGRTHRGTSSCQRASDGRLGARRTLAGGRLPGGLGRGRTWLTRCLLETSLRTSRLSNCAFRPGRRCF